MASTPAITLNRGSTDSRSARPDSTDSNQVRSKRKSVSGCWSRYSIIRGCRMSEANFRSGLTTVKARLKSSDSSSMSRLVRRPISRPNIPSGLTCSGGNDAPVSSATTPNLWLSSLVVEWPCPSVVCSVV